MRFYFNSLLALIQEEHKLREHFLRIWQESAMLVPISQFSTLPPKNHLWHHSLMWIAGSMVVVVLFYFSTPMILFWKLRSSIAIPSNFIMKGNEIVR